MLAVSAWAWPQIPADAQVPVHWGVDGEPDGYGPKWLGLLAMPAVALGIVGLLAAIPRIEPRRQNLERSATAYVAIGIAIVTFLAVLHVVAVLATLGSDVDITAIALFGAGALFVVMGNFLGKTRSNWFFGIRTPWTLSSERSWTLTHRLGGWLFVGIGVLVLVSTVLFGASVAIWVMLGALLVGVAGLLAYSYLVWRDDPARAGARAAR
jgi:uncharacterized membrane protein